MNAGSDAEATPSLTVITMLEYVPTCADVGMPIKRPVKPLKLAQGGRFTTENDSASPSASEAVGWKVYVCPATAIVAGMSAIVGGLLVDVGVTVRGVAALADVVAGEESPCEPAQPTSIDATNTIKSKCLA